MKTDRKHHFTVLNSGIDYELLDCGHFRKLERFGNLILDRPEIEAKQEPHLPKKEWEKAHWFFAEKKGQAGEWHEKNKGENKWPINYQYQSLKIAFSLKLTSFKHVGIFPEQAENWKYIQRQLRIIKGDKKVLNLFAYTGAASVVAAASGATVTNVDSVKQVLNWGKQNAENNEVESIRWILEDARKFVAKAIRRGEKYQGIVMDPPAFGYGTKNEKWKLERDLKDLLEQVVQLLDPERHFFILNTYSPKLNQKELLQMVRSIKGFPHHFELSTLALMTGNKKILPLGNLLRFSH